jgi:glycine reductase complex component B subunit alpha and beta
MQLDIASFRVRRVEFGRGTRLEGDVLHVDREELVDLVREDARIATVELELVEPGESARIIHVCEAIEPRRKVAGPGACYPGIMGPVDTVGSGTTHRLDGVAVVVSAEYPPLLKTGVGAARESILDMTGPGALSPLTSVRNIVLSLRVAPGNSLADCHQSIQRAGFKVAHRLAQVTDGCEPVRVERFELGGAVEGLPRVLYLHQVLTQLNVPVPSFTWYGMPITDWMPAWAHPNEVLDGALVPSALGGGAIRPTAWEHVNHPLLARLYAEHGKSLDFRGMILHRTRFETFEQKQLSANQAAKLAASLGAEGAIITWVGAGNAFIEGMLTAQALERVGIKAVFMTYEHGGKDGREQPLMFSVPEADALVSVGSLDRPIVLPAVDRVVGGPDLNVNPEAGLTRLPSAAPIALDWYLPLASAVDHWGFGTQACAAF